MFESNIKTRYFSLEKERLFQGDVLRDVDLVTGRRDGAMEDFSLPYCIVMSQECDLEQDFKQRKEKSVDHDKNLLTILICPAYPDEQFFQGIHLSEKNMKSFNAKEAERLKGNDVFNRFHHLPELEGTIPGLVVDFKHFFTVPRDLLYEQYRERYLVSLNELFRERLSQRFANYLSRIGLPEL